MNHIEIFKEKEISCIYTFIGKEEYIKEKALNSIKDKIVSMAELNFNVFDDFASIQSVYEACQTLPFMSERRMVVFKLSSFALIKEDFTQLLNNIPTTTCLVIYISGDGDKRKKIYKELKENSILVEFEPIEEFEALRWVVNAFKKQNKCIEQKDAQKLVDKIGTSVSLLNSEVDKLINLSGDRPNINKEDIDGVIAINLNYDVFAMINCFLFGDEKQGYNILNNLIKNKVSGFMILGAMAGKFRSYYTAKNLLSSGKSSNEVIKALGSNYGAKKAVSECAKLTTVQIKNAIDTFEYCDMAIKNGFMSEENAVYYGILAIKKA